MRKYYTSESVSEGHPDKLADFISDSILDEFLRQEPTSRVAVETLVTTGMAVVAGEVRAHGDHLGVEVESSEQVHGEIALLTNAGLFTDEEIGTTWALTHLPLTFTPRRRGL